MLRVLVDSGSSIKAEEQEKYNVELIPLRFLLGEKEYQDSVDITIDEFYSLFIGQKLFPRTSLPYLDVLEEKVNGYAACGDDVIIITISSKISGTYNAVCNLFEGNDRVRVVDSLTAVGGIRLIVEEINRNRELPVEQIIEKVNAIIPKIRVIAIPETLDYLMKGGRLSKMEWLFGSILNLKPLITFVDGVVKVAAKKMGLKQAMRECADTLIKQHCDENYPIIASYTYNSDNLEKLIGITDDRYKPLMSEYDNLCPVIACHWGPNAFGYIFVSKD
ncbi:MAG: DegV family protein [Corallococcus sp.]|nr:DegV family protein [Bacillota bacterium]MCM1534036.1 DegV family protein [Corallococcus sp.]